MESNDAHERAQMEQIAKEVDRTVQSVVGERRGYVLVVFSEERLRWISNCRREDAKAAIVSWMAQRLTIDEMKALLDRIESN